MSRDDSPKLLFKDFIYLFQLQFYYNGNVKIAFIELK